MKGSYILLIKIKNQQLIKIGKLGIIEFLPGYYAYIGSALNNLEKRIQRHLSTEKNFFWHIDYLLDNAEILNVFRVKSSRRLECIIAEILSKRLQSVQGFGCSDCRCKSHLFYYADRTFVENSIHEAVDNSNLKVQ